MTVNIASSILLRGLQSKLEQNKFTIMQDTTEKCGKVHGGGGVLGAHGHTEGSSYQCEASNVTALSLPLLLHNGRGNLQLAAAANLVEPRTQNEAIEVLPRKLDVSSVALELLRG